MFVSCKPLQHSLIFANKAELISVELLRCSFPIICSWSYLQILDQAERFIRVQGVYSQHSVLFVTYESAQ
jgi:hypothetical protein